MFKRLEAYRKTVVAILAAAGGYIAVIQTSDFSTKEGVIGAVIAILGVAGVYGTPNAPK